MRFIHRADVGSTNDEVRKLAEMGECGPLWLYADSQTKGRGRHGREWTSVSGNLYASGLFALPAKPMAGAQLGFAAALAIADTVAVYAPEAEIALKWPNDVLVGGAKISGILLETGEGDARPFVIVGIGLNLLTHPEDTPYPATHLLAHIPKAKLAGPEPLFTGTETVLAVLSSNFEHWRRLHGKQGFEGLRGPWLERAQGIGRVAKIRLPSRSFHAKLLGLGANGELQVEHEDGTLEPIYAGDVFPNVAGSES